MSKHKEDAAPSEEERLIALESYNIFDADIKDQLSGLIELASGICETPISLVNLLDSHHQITKANKGWNLGKIPLESSFCRYTIKGDELMIVEDTHQDERFKNSPFVQGNPNIRFYAGAPLTNKDGNTLGALCVVDTKKRTLTGKQKASLQLLADEAMARLELLKRNIELDKSEVFLNNSSDIQAIIDPSTRCILEVNEEAMNFLSCEKEDLIGKPFGNRIVDKQIREKVLKFLKQNKKSQASFAGPVKTKSGEIKFLDHSFTLKDGFWYMTARDETRREEARIELEKEKKFSENIIDNLPGIFYLADSKGRMRRWNKSFERLVGLSSKEIEDSPILTYFDADKSHLLDKKLSETFSKGKAEAEGYLIAKNGERIPHLFRGFRFRAGEQLFFAGIGVDISKRKQAEKNLQNALVRLSRAQEIAKIGNWEFDRETGKHRWSDETYRILGYDMEEYTADYEKFWKALHPDDVEKVTSDMEALERGESITGTEHRIICQDTGAVKHVIERAEPEFDENGKLVKISGTVQDITESKKTELKLEKRSQAIKASIDGIAIWDEGKNFTFMNDSHARMYGYTEKELMGKRWELLFPSEERKRFKEIIDKELNSARQWRGETTGRKKDGSVFPVEMSLARIDSGGLICIVRDITDQKQLLKKLEETQIEKDTILNSASDCIVTINHLGKVVGFNPASEKIFGYSKEEILGKSLSETIIPGRHREDHEEGMKHYMDTGEGPIMGQLIEMPALRKDGTELPVELKVNEIQGTEKPMFMGIIRDISERREAQERLQKTLKNLSQAQELAELGSWHWFILENKIQWSDNVYDIYGIENKAAKPTLELFLERVHPEDRGMMQTLIHDLEKGEPFPDLVHRLLVPNGTVKWVRHTGELRYDENGKPREVVGAVQDITDQKTVQLRLEREKKLSERIINSLPVDFFMFDSDDNMVRWNDNLLKNTGYNEQEIAYLNPLDYFPREEQQIIKKKIAKAYKEGEAKVEAFMLTKNGGKIPSLINASHFQSEGQSYLLGTSQNIQALKHYQQQLEESLKEKEVLLAEIHHRVKNNLAIISGLLQLEMFSVENEQVQKSMQNSQMRIKSMAIVHEMLYNSNDFNNISFDRFVSKIIKSIEGVQGPSGENVDFQLDVGNIDLNVNQAIPLGLIINELITNAHKHAFTEEMSGTIEVSLRREGEMIELKVKDDGIGLPENFSIEQSDSFGFTLISTLALQLGADIQIQSSGGTEIVVTFKKEDKKGSASSLSVG